MKILKKVFAVALCFVLTLSAAPLGGFVGLDLSGLFDFKAEATSYSGTCGDNLNWTLDTETGLLEITGTGAMTNWDLYSNVPWYSYRSSIKTVNIANGITSIGSFVFNDCTSLTSVTIPDGVTSIGKLAFDSCTSLTSITIPDSVTSIGNSAFNGCISLTSIIIPDSVTSIGNYAFSYCDSLTSVTIPDSVTSIGNIAFEDCTSLTSFTVDEENTNYSSDEYGVLFNKDKTQLIQYPIGNKRTSYTIPDSVTSIGDYAFKFCKSLASVTIGNSVTSIGSAAFYGCTSLTNVTIPDSLTSIGISAFRVCTSLTSVTIPDGVASIGKLAFDSCTSLTSVTIGNGVTSIGDYAFEDCTSLTCVTIPDGVTSIGTSAFSGCSKLILMLKKDSYAETYANNNSFIYYYIYDDSEEKTISVIVTSKLSFEIDKETYTMIINCSGNMVSFGDENAPWVAYKNYIKHIIFNESCTSVCDNAFKNMYGLKNVTIPNSITSIGSYAFYNCSSLVSVTIGNSVTSIGSYAFYYCNSLVNITVDEGNTVYSSDEYGVLFNKGKTKIIQCPAKNERISYTIPDSVTSIGNYAFYYCRSLASVTIPDSVTSIGSDAFSGCTALKNIYYTGDISSWLNISFNLYNSNPLYYGAKLYFDGELVTDIVIPDGTESIKAYAFYGYTSLMSVTIGNGVTSIGFSAFSDCTSLASVIIPDSVTSIGYSAFSDCTSLTSITIPDSVTSISDSAFYNCSGLLELTMPVSAKIYNSSNTFYNCTKIKKITLTKGDGTAQGYGTNTSTSSSTTYYQYTPWYFSRAKCTEVIIEDGVTGIVDYMFYGCTGITELTIPASAKIYNSSDTFFNCTNIEKITLTKGNGTVQDYTSSTAQYTPWYISREYCTKVVVEDGVAGIGDYMFYNCAEIGDITLPFSVQSIGTNAFVGCQNLGKLKIYNRNCEFETNAISYYTTIVGYAGSTAEAYANENGFDFELIPDNDHEHTYSNSCDNECNICGYIISGRGHSFANGCDSECDVCGYTRTDLVHTYTHDCDPDCDFCGYTRTDLVHKDENSDGKCDACGVYLSDIQVGVTQNVKVTAGKTVLLKFIPTQSGVYTFTSSSSSDTYGYIYDADKKQLASNDDGGEGNNFSITYTLKKGTVYYLGVRFYSSSSSGEIPVKLTLDEIICDHINTHPEHMDPTCAQTGYDKVICDDCGDTVSTTVIATIPHTYKTIVAEPTCVDEGVVVCLCSVCRDGYIDEILDPLGHSEPVWKTVVKPTTKLEGTMNYVCPACDEVFDTKSIPAITLSDNSTANVNYTTNTITGFDAGSTELEDYLSATNNGYVFTCQSEIICTGAVVELTDGDTLINSYTVVIYGDLNGDGWYDSEDAFLVNLIVAGFLTREDIPDYMWTAADCNYDGEINETDVDLLNGAGLKLNSVDQTKPVEELATNSVYIEYVMLIDQSADCVVLPDTHETQQDTTSFKTNETVEPDEPLTETDVDFDFDVFLSYLLDFFKNIFYFVLTLI